MKSMFLATTLFVLAQVALGQRMTSKIDTLSSNSAVEALIYTLNGDPRRFVLKTIAEFNEDFNEHGMCRKIADSLSITKPFYRTDFDNNGYTDLLAIGDFYGYSIFVVMNYDKDYLKLYRLTRRRAQEYSFPQIINDTIIRYHYMSEYNWRTDDTITSLLVSNLVFKYGDFIEFNPRPRHHAIKKIAYQTSTCFGTCPMFSIDINIDKTAIFEAEAFNMSVDTPGFFYGKFKTTIKDESFSGVVDLLNYIDFPNLKDRYAVSATDNQTCTLTVTYNNGQVKTIKDYGMIGTFGLDRLYQLLFDLRYNQDWKKI